MSATREGGLKAAETNKRRYGEDFYRKMGAAGGKKSRGGGFQTDKVGKDGLTGPERARLAGHLGGSRRPGEGKQHKEGK